MRNKARRSAIATRMRKVFKALDEFKNGITAEDELKPTEVLISEAFSEIDKAVVKGILHKNTGDRKKARLSVAKRNVLITAGLYAPA